MDLSKKESDTFLSTFLQIDNVHSWFEKDRYGLLSEIIKRIMYNTTFHNVDLLATAPQDRKVPSLEDNKNLMLSAEGGLCWTRNSFLLALLKNIGYSVYPVAASVGELDLECKTHISIMATDVVKKDDRYLIDAGFGSPMFTAMPLDFEDHSPNYKHSYQEFRYIWENGMGIRQHRSRGSTVIDFTEADKGWQNAYYFMPQPVDITYFLTTMQHIYETSDDQGANVSIFQGSLRVVGYFNGKCVAVKDSTLLQEGDDQVLHPTELHSLEEVVNAVMNHFPQFRDSKQKVTAAVREWARVSGAFS